MARSPKGTGGYLVHLELLEEGGTGEVVLGHARSRTHLVSAAEGTRWLSAPLLDPFGQPLSGQAVEWQAGDPCPEGFCAAGSPVTQPSSWNGYAYMGVDVSTGVAHPLHRASVPSGASGKATLDRSASLKRAEQALAEQPHLGWVHAADGAAGRASLVLRNNLVPASKRCQRVATGASRGWTAVVGDASEGCRRPAPSSRMLSAVCWDVPTADLRFGSLMRPGATNGAGGGAQATRRYS